MLAERTGLLEERPSAVRLLEEYAAWAGRDADDDQRAAALAAQAAQQRLERLSTRGARP